jgi:hypothetical protein
VKSLACEGLTGCELKHERPPGSRMSWAPPSRGLAVDVMAKRSQGLLNGGTLFRGLLAVSGVAHSSVRVARGGGRFFFSRLQGGRFGRPRACLGATRAAPPTPRGRCSGQPRSK